MDELDDLLNKVVKLNEKERYIEVIDLLDADKLDWYNSSSLFSEKAQAYYRLKKYTESRDMALKAISINENDVKGNHYLGNYYLDNKLYKEAVEKFDKLIKLHPDYPYAYYGSATGYSQLKQQKKAVELFKKGLEINPDDIQILNGLGRLLYNQKKYKEALPYFQKSIEVKPKNSYACNMIGIIENNLGNYESATKYYSKAIELDKYNNAPVYNRALLYFNEKEYKKSKIDYERYLEMSKGVSDFYTKNARSRIVELKKLIKSTEYNEITNIVNKIRDLLLFKDGCITHYTSLSVARALILEDSLFRLSEGAFLNDTSEGRELFKFLSFHLPEPRGNETIAEKFSQKPFIGSFVAETKHDDLTLWRMYGKEQKDEAKGCALTFDMNKLLESINNELISINEVNDSNTKSKEEINFYRVAYRRPGSPEEFIIPNATPMEQKKLNEYMIELQQKINLFKSKKRKTKEDIQNLLGLLNEIAYLFKSDEYRFENEVRLAIKGNALNKIIDYNFLPPRVYIELVGTRNLLRKITLGPKVERADEWAAAFYYDLEKDNLCPEILISHLPFK